MSILGKTALTILLITAIAAAALWLLGGKQAEYSTALSIDAPPEAIFPFLTQPERLKSWTAELSEVAEFVPAPKVDGIASGRVKKTERIMSKADGSQIRYQDQVIRYQENQAVSVQSSNAQQVVTYIFKLEPRDGQTFVTYRIKTNSCGTGRFLAPILGNDFQNRIDEDVRKLKTLVESSPRVEVTSQPRVLDLSSDPTPDVSNASTGQIGGPGARSRIERIVPSEKPKAELVTPRSIPPVSESTNRSPDARDAETPVSGQPFSF